MRRGRGNLGGAMLGWRRGCKVVMLFWAGAVEELTCCLFGDSSCTYCAYLACWEVLNLEVQF